MGKECGMPVSRLREIILREHCNCSYSSALDRVMYSFLKKIDCYLGHHQTENLWY